MLIPQGCQITASVEFQFINPGTKRTISVKRGDKFTVLNTQVNQQNTGLFLLDRSKKARLGVGYRFTWDMLVQYFSADKLPPSYFA